MCYLPGEVLSAQKLSEHVTSQNRRTAAPEGGSGPAVSWFNSLNCPDRKDKGRINKEATCPRSHHQSGPEPGGQPPSGFPVWLPFSLYFLRHVCFLPKCIQTASARAVERSVRRWLCKADGQIPNTGTVCLKMFGKICVSRGKTQPGSSAPKDSKQQVMETSCLMKWPRLVTLQKSPLHDQIWTH